MSNDVSNHSLEAPGARIAYQVRGSGPLLLVIGQPMTKEYFGPFADLLATDHRVVTYDPRGLGESTVEDPTQLITPQIQAADLALIIDQLGDGPAVVFGSSGGAVTGLALAAGYPDKVSTLVAHEPPVADLLDDAENIRSAVDKIEDAYRAYGPGAAWGAFVGLVMHQGPMPADGPAPMAWPPGGGEAAADDKEDTAPEPPSAKKLADDELFFLRLLKPFTRYEVPIDQLRDGAPRIITAIGADSHTEIARRSTDALAAQLGQEAVAFPGDHAGFMSQTEPFAAKLREVVCG